MNSLTLVTKLILNLGLKTNTLVNIWWCFVLYKMYEFIKCRRNRRISVSIPTESSGIELNEMNNVPTSSTANHIVVVSNEIASTDMSLSLISQLKIALLKLLKFNFTSTALILLQLVHCERIHDGLHLYIFGDHVCYVWWQWLIIIVLLPMVVIFPL